MEQIITQGEISIHDTRTVAFVISNTAPTVRDAGALMDWRSPHLWFQNRRGERRTAALTFVLPYIRRARR